MKAGTRGRWLIIHNTFVQALSETGIAGILCFTLLVAILLSSAMALTGSRSLRERLYAATYLLLCCTVTTLVGSWLMYLIHG